MDIQMINKQQNRSSGIICAGNFNRINKPYVIINPASAGGKTAKRTTKIINKFNRYFGNNYFLVTTEKPFDGEKLARRAISQGCELIIAVGGDGTLQEIINGFFSKGELTNPNCCLGIINSGTGQGLAQSLNLPADMDKQFQIIKEGQSIKIDVGCVKFQNKTITFDKRIFVNEFQLGIGGTVVQRVENRKKRFGGTITFGITALTTLFQYKSRAIKISIDNWMEMEKAVIGIIVANGVFTGGGMHIAPYAKLNDGWLEVVVIHDQSIPERLWNFPTIYQGNHLKREKFDHYRAKSIQLYGQPDVLLAADGELFGSLPCTINVVPNIIPIKYKL